MEAGRCLSRLLGGAGRKVPGGPGVQGRERDLSGDHI